MVFRPVERVEGAEWVGVPDGLGRLGICGGLPGGRAGALEFAM